MVKNVPNTYTQDKFEEEFKETHGGMYDAASVSQTGIQLITDKKQLKCKGYGFINFTHPLYLVDFYQEYNNKTWKCDLKSGRRIELAYALKEQWNSHFTMQNAMNIKTRGTGGLEPLPNPN